jgi:RNA polymerase sigma factor (sigma-70 family)
MAQILRAMRACEQEGLSDGQLLEQFVHRRDEAAFGTLLQRHGPMVFGVCLRVLGNAADAEDAFQATFLVLVRKAHSLTTRAVLGDFLHGVAQRTALNARRLAARRRVKEAAMARSEAQGEEARDNGLKECLDEALTRLPPKYRLPIILCDLEGQTRQQAAESLGWPEGTVAGRLARGRALLARRVAQRGLAPSVSVLATGFAENAASASVPAALLSSTIKAATLIVASQTAMVGVVSANVAVLVEGALKNMMLNKLKTVTAVLFVMALLGAGATASVLAYQDKAATPPAAGKATDPKSDKENPGPDTRKAAGKLAPDRKVPATAAPDKSDRIQVGELLSMHVLGAFPEAPIQGLFKVEASGKVALGPPYGRVDIKGLSLEEAEAAVKKHLEKLMKRVDVSLTRALPAIAGTGTDRKLEQRVQQLEKEVRALRSAIEELQKKTRK